jgi:hypothetical protein
MENLQLRRQSDGAQISAEVRRCTIADFDALFCLQNCVHDAMPDPEQFVMNDDGELKRDIEQGLCVGVWAGEELAAYGILRYCGVSEHNYANYLDVPASDLAYWANGDTVVVGENWRGNRLQQKLIGYLIRWRNPEIIGFGCTVSPQNAFSYDNLKAMGFEVHTRRMMYGSHDRYVMKLALEPLPGRYRHFKGNEYRVLAIARNSETRERMVVYQALYGEQGIWVRPASMWFQHIDRDGYHGPRFVFCGE